MTAKERVRIALDGGKPDRVPFLLECDYDYMAIAAGRAPWQYEFGDEAERAAIHEDLYRRHPTDLWKCWGGRSRRLAGQRQVVMRGGEPWLQVLTTGREYRIDRLGNLSDGQGRPVALDREGKEVSQQSAAVWVASDGYPRSVESEADIEELLGPVPPAPFWIEDGFLATLERLLPKYGQSHFLMFPLNTIFADALDLFGGFQAGLEATYSKRALFHRALEVIVEWKKSRLRAGASLGAPGAWMIEYCAGADTISPAMYREFVFPYEQEVAREAHRLGLRTYMWYLGHVMPLVPDLARLEVDALFPEQGRKGYEVDIVEMRRLVGERMCLIGFNDEQALIRGDQQGLVSEMRRQIEGAGRDGAFIMGTTIITGDTPVEHVDFYVQALAELGDYRRLGA